MNLESMSTAEVRRLLDTEHHRLGHHELLRRRGISPDQMFDMPTKITTKDGTRISRQCLLSLPHVGGITPL